MLHDLIPLHQGKVLLVPEFLSGVWESWRPLWTVKTEAKKILSTLSFTMSCVTRVCDPFSRKAVFYLPSFTDVEALLVATRFNSRQPLAFLTPSLNPCLYSPPVPSALPSTSGIPACHVWAQSGAPGTSIQASCSLCLLIGIPELRGGKKEKKTATKKNTPPALLDLSSLLDCISQKIALEPGDLQDIHLGKEWPSLKGSIKALTYETQSFSADSNLLSTSTCTLLNSQPL